MTTRKTTRRAVLAGTAAALTIGTVAASAVNPDAELLALGHKLDPLLAEWSTVHRQCNADRAAFEERVFRVTGIRMECKGDGLDALEATMGESEFAAYSKTRAEIANDPGTQDRDFAFDDKWTSIYERISPIIDAIYSMPAQTLAGLAIKARAASFDNADWWLDDCAENGRAALKTIVEDVCRIAGVPMIDVLSEVVS